MAQFELKNGQGSAFPKTKTNDKQPDYSGKILTPNGEMLEIAIWNKIAQSGTNYFSIAVSLPYNKDENKDKNKDKNKDDMPF